MSPCLRIVRRDDGDLTRRDARVRKLCYMNGGNRGLALLSTPRNISIRVHQLAYG